MPGKFSEQSPQIIAEDGIARAMTGDYKLAKIAREIGNTIRPEITVD